MAQAKSPSGSGSRSLLTSPLAKLSFKCYNCGKAGHVATACPYPQAIPRCNLCGLKHSGRCKLQVTCYNCYTPGHTVAECGGRTKLGPWCSLCAQTGHFRDGCMEVNATRSSKHLKTWQTRSGVVKSLKQTHNVLDDIICMSCGAEGHYVCNKNNPANPNKMFPARGVCKVKSGSAQDKTKMVGTCWNCGFDRHFGSQCREPNFVECLKGGAGEWIRDQTKTT